MLKGKSKEELQKIRERTIRAMNSQDKTRQNLSEKLGKVYDASANLMRIRKQCDYWEGKLNGEHCPAREEEEDGYFTCHMKKKFDYGRSLFRRQFYPICRDCEATYQEKLRAGVWGRTFDKKTIY